MSGNSPLLGLEDEDRARLQTTMNTVVTETFEKMGFMAAAAVEPPPELPKEICAASIQITAPQKATLSLIIPQELAWLIADNLYGPEDLSNELIADMLGELVNTISGKLLSLIIPTQHFTLAIPQTNPKTIAWPSLALRYAYNVDNQGIIFLVIESA